MQIAVYNCCSFSTKKPSPTKSSLLPFVDRKYEMRVNKFFVPPPLGTWQEPQLPSPIIYRSTPVRSPTSFLRSGGKLKRNDHVFFRRFRTLRFFFFPLGQPSQRLPSDWSRARLSLCRCRLVIIPVTITLLTLFVIILYNICWVGRLLATREGDRHVCVRTSDRKRTLDGRPLCSGRPSAAAANRTRFLS